jgi:restriction system protein
MSAWVVRAGLVGARDLWAVENGVAGGGFHEVGSLQGMATRSEIQAAVEAAFKGEHPGKIGNYTGQLNAFRHSVKPGDLVVTPLKTTKKLAIGICTEGYTYEESEPDHSKRHRIGVDWQRTDVPRAAIKDDLLNTSNGAMSIFRADRNEAEKRLRLAAKTGVDPGLYGTKTPLSTSSASPAADDVEDVTDLVAVPTIQSIRDRVQTHLIENFKGHKLTHLVADIMRTKGFTCEVSPEGPDGGVDILVGSGPLGLDEPKLVVEVKSEETQIDALVVRGLQGAISSQGASQGLLVAWGGLNGPARREILKDRLKIRVWEAEHVLDQLFAVYEDLPDETQRLIPLKRAWVLDEDEVDG